MEETGKTCASEQRRGKLIISVVCGLFCNLNKKERKNFKMGLNSKFLNSYEG